jgi:hypothetical protein
MDVVRSTLRQAWDEDFCLLDLAQFQAYLQAVHETFGKKVFDLLVSFKHPEAVPLYGKEDLEWLEQRYRETLNPMLSCRRSVSLSVAKGPYAQAASTPHNRRRITRISSDSAG